MTQAPFWGEQSVLELDKGMTPTLLHSRHDSIGERSDVHHCWREGRGASLRITQGAVHLLAQATLTPVAKLLSHLSKALCGSVLLCPLEQG